MPQDIFDFAEQWKNGWNSHDLNTILGHYRDDVIFRSKKAIPLVGKGEIHGKQALREYWSAAIQRQPDLKFTIQDVFEGYDMLVIAYRNQRGILATETLYFDADGKVFQAAACHQCHGG